MYVMHEVVQTTRGASARASDGSSRSVSSTCDRKLTWCTSSKPSSLRACLVRPPGLVPMPALLQRMSSARPVSSQRRANASTLCSLPMSISHHSTLLLSWPAARATALQWSATAPGCFSAGLTRQASTRLAPHWAKCSAACSPMPLLAPEMTIQRPLRFLAGTSCSVSVLPAVPSQKHL
ncbi:hypothetical protein CRV24_004023 [Beauveria bassiana]|nr:hypothetical protein CRV24_004023 [Beauveria bassiana]